MPRSSVTRLLVLHAVRLKGFAEPDAVAELAGVAHDDVVKHLDALLDDGMVVHREGRVTGWQLTATGRTEQERLLAEELDDTGTRDAVDSAYRRFLALNGELLEACTAWQLRDDAINDHADTAYDEGVIERLRSLHARAQPILTDLETALERYEGYRDRFDTALERLGDGETDWFT